MKVQLLCKYPNQPLENLLMLRFRNQIDMYSKMQALQFSIKDHIQCSRKLHKDNTGTIEVFSKQ